MADPEIGMVIAHLDNPDKASHKYTPDSEQVSARLRDTDQLLEKIWSAMDKNTTIVVIGDHG